MSKQVFTPSRVRITHDRTESSRPADYVIHLWDKDGNELDIQIRGLIQASPDGPLVEFGELFGEYVSAALGREANGE